MRIIRAFLHRTSYMPDDDMVFVGYLPGLLIKKINTCFIIVTFNCISSK